MKWPLLASEGTVRKQLFPTKNLWLNSMHRGCSLYWKRWEFQARAKIWDQLWPDNPQITLTLYLHLCSKIISFTPDVSRGKYTFRPSNMGLGAVISPELHREIPLIHCLPPNHHHSRTGLWCPLGQWVTHTPRSVLGSTPPYHQLNPGQRDGHLGGQKRRQGLGGGVAISGADWRSAEEGRICCCGGNKSLSCRK